ncbi:unnamed protein product [Periconia digitata]|uniref:Uncharacterized protein n=1 Tax=Periconia digitata TaxID=1303443 RepID=A0A9W4UA03_9PLEO|nr:unnamed protein product [Periconia digitata]
MSPTEFPKLSNLTALLRAQTASPSPSPSTTAGNPTLYRCPPQTHTRLQHLNVAEVVTLFTPFVPHPPNTTLDKNMDPFEPLGRAVHRPVRHIPYRLDHGMTETHGDFLSASGAIMLVVCAAANVRAVYPRAFEQQVRFCRDVVEMVGRGGQAMESVPVVLVLISEEGTVRQNFLDQVRDFDVVCCVNSYQPMALANSVRIVFGL